MAQSLFGMVKKFFYICFVIFRCICIATIKFFVIIRDDTQVYRSNDMFINLDFP